VAAVIRRATAADAAAVVRLSAALMAHEELAPPEALRAAVDRLLADPSLGFVLVLELDGALRGHAVCTFGYDLEHAGRDAFLTELFVDADVRGGHGAALLAEVERAAAADGAAALHLQVRPENPAARLYARAGFARVPRVLMSKRLR
jgi:ribosomal protein S18 acetylase RimI-like enzyme